MKECPVFQMRNEDGDYPIEHDLFLAHGWAKDNYGVPVLTGYQPTHPYLREHDFTAGSWDAALLRPLTPAARQMLAIARGRR